jgi:hypothetical protein
MTTSAAGVDARRRERRPFDWVLPVLSILVGAIGGWYLGLVAYRRTLAALLNQRASSADLSAIGFWISIGLAITLVFAYLPLIYWLHARFAKAAVRGFMGLLCGAALAPVPVSIVMLGWGGRISTLWSVEALLMWVWAAVAGPMVVAAGSLFPELWAQRTVGKSV